MTAHKTSGLLVAAKKILDTDFFIIVCYFAIIDTIKISSTRVQNMATSDDIRLKGELSKRIADH